MRIGKVQYNGVSSDTLGVFVSGSGSYDAAEFDVTNYQVPGRNGDILIPNNRYKNIDITYPCFIPNDFETRVQAVRNWMRSARSYARIEDNYDLLHYRMGIGKGVLKFSPAQQSIGANAQLVFNCKPQRFLKSGEEEQDVVRTPYSFTGDTVEFETDEVKTLEKAEVTLAPSQDGTPWISTTPDTEPYLYRALPSNVGNSELDTIVGGTVNFNQLCNSSSVTVPSGHKYYLFQGGTKTILQSSGSAITGLTNGTDMVIDLTAMFGSSIADYIYTLESGTAGAGVAWLKKYGFITKDYYAYDPGSLLSVKTSAHKIVGFNQWDKSAVVSGAYINDANGSAVSNGGAKHTGYIDVIPGQTYYIRSDQTGGAWGAWYDFDKNYISGITGYIASGPQSAKIKTAPANARYMRLTCIYSTGGGDIDTFCVNLSDPDRNGTYEAYSGPTYPLDSDLELRGTLALDANNNLVYDGDVYPPSGNVTRDYTKLNLSEISWTARGSGSNHKAYSHTLPSAERSAYYTNSAICDVLPYISFLSSIPTTGTSADNLKIGIYLQGTSSNGYGGNIITVVDVNDSALTSGHIVYKLKTETTESADPYTSPQSVSDGGTEEYVDSRTVPMPVGHRSYYANIVPITGETGANLVHTGVNLLGGTDLKDAVVAAMPSATVDTTNKYVSFASGATMNQPITKSLSGIFKENTRYTFIMTIYKTAGTGSNLDIRYTDGTHALLGPVSAATTKETIVFVSAANKTVASMIKYNQSGYTRIYYEESGIFEGVLTASQFTEYQGTTYNVTFTDQGTVYGGTYDFVSGTLTVTYGCIASYNGETIGTPWLSSYEEYSVGATPTTGAQVVYPLDSPQTYTLTPNVINSVIGLNYVWSDYPPVSVGYSDPFDAHNPTQYDAKPLLKLENPLTGAVINVNAFTITATTSYTGVVEIDCESQNIYSGDTNLNSIFTVSNFPVLGEGKNVITFSDADSLKIVPRWWEL